MPAPTTTTNPALDTDLATSLLACPKHHHHHHHDTTATPSTTATTCSSTAHECSCGEAGKQQRGQHTTGEDPSAALAISHTGEWKPKMDRRQSWDAQEYRHEVQKRMHMTGGENGGFSEV